MSLDYENTLALQIRKDIVRGLSDYQMIQAGDRVLVCVSGGKDSAVLLALLRQIQKRSPYSFELAAVLLDQKQPAFSLGEFRNWVQDELKIPLSILERDTYSIVKEKTPKGKAFCTLCSRFRRAILYDFASENGFTKMALGHHRDDINTTALLNLFYIGTLATMPPKLLSDDGRNIVIRPMLYVAEKDIEALAKAWQIPVLPCQLCGSQDNLKRGKIKNLIHELEGEIPNLSASLLTALGHVQPRHLLDKDLWDFNALKKPESKDHSSLVSVANFELGL